MKISIRMAVAAALTVFLAPVEGIGADASSERTSMPDFCSNRDVNCVVPDGAPPPARAAQPQAVTPPTAGTASGSTATGSGTGTTSGSFQGGESSGTSGGSGLGRGAR